MKVENSLSSNGLCEGIKSIISKNRSSLNDEEIAILEEAIRYLESHKDGNEPPPVDLFIKVIDLITKFWLLGEHVFS